MLMLFREETVCAIPFIEFLPLLTLCHDKCINLLAKGIEEERG